MDGEPVLPEQDPPVRHRGRFFVLGEPGDGYPRTTARQADLRVVVVGVGDRILYNPMVMSATTANLPTGEAGWFAFWRYSSKVSTATAFRVLQLT